MGSLGVGPIQVALENGRVPSVFNGGSECPAPPPQEVVLC